MHSNHPHFTPPNRETEDRVDKLLAQLSLDEKLLMLGGKPGQGGKHANSSIYGIERLGLPDLRMADGPTGVHWWCDASTTYPAPLAAAASWNSELWYEFGEAIGRDCRARGVHILLAPGVNIYRSPLCGRNFEYAGEDPWLSSQFGVAYVRGVQDMGVCATIKHYAVNYQEFARHTVSSDVDERTLHEIYLPAFKAAVQQGGCGALMTAYNLVNSVQCSEHAGLIVDTLKGDWQFDGVVMSDWLSTYSVADAANAGLDLEMPTAAQWTAENLKPLLALGEVSEEVIDDKVRRILRLAVCFGWLDHVQLDDSIAQEDLQSAETALRLARQGVVLLKNEQALLPLDRNRLSTIAVIGPNAHPAVFGGGGSSFNEPFRATSLRDGVERVSNGVEVLHAAGPEPNPQRGVFDSSAFECEQGSGMWAEYFNNTEWEGPPAVSRLDSSVNFSWGIRSPADEITQERFSVRWQGAVRPTRSGVHVFHTRSHDSAYRVWIDGELVIDTIRQAQNGPHRVERSLEQGRSYPVVIEFRKERFFTGMQFGYEFSDGGKAEIARCAAVAQQADVAVVTVGWDNVSEAEGFDRGFSLHPEMEEMLLAVCAVQPKTVVVILAGGNLDMSRWADRAPAILHAFYPGQAGGHAVAEILFGLVNPSAKLPFTMEAALEQRSSTDCYHDTDNSGRVELRDGIFTGYRHFDRADITPRYPFGFGLSYTTFAYRDLQVSPAQLSSDGSWEVKLQVVNEGDRAGAEVVQVYLSALNPSVARPPKELKGFARIELAAGESGEVTVPLEPSAFEHYDDSAHRWTLAPGKFEVLVGASSRDIRLRTTVSVG